MRSKVSSDWLPSYIKATLPVLEIFNMAGYFSYSSRMFPVEAIKWEPSCSMWKDGHDEADGRFSQFCTRAYKYD